MVNAVSHIYENTVSANLRKEERAKQTKDKKQKKFADYDWQKPVGERKLDALTLYVPDKYLRAHNICFTKRKKLDKIKIIIAHHESGKSVLRQTPVEVTLMTLVTLPIQIILTWMSCTVKTHHLILSAQVTQNNQYLKLQISVIGMF